MTRYVDQPLKTYVNDLAARLDAPGGGSACGLTGALAAALGAMVCQFTLGKKKYAEVEDRIKELLEHFEKFRGEFTRLMQEDVDVFQAQMGNAYALPKETPVQQEIRKQAIEAACKASCRPPLEIARNCFYLFELLLELADIGTTQLISDVGVAGALAFGAFEGARYNIDINLKYITDATFAREVRSEVAAMAEKVDVLKARIAETMDEKMGGA